MSKNTPITFVGQPIFSQIMSLIPNAMLQKLIKEHRSDHYYKRFKTWDHLCTLLFGILSRCDSMGEICEGMKGMSGKLRQMGLKSAPAKSTAGDGHRNRDNRFFESLYYQLIDRYDSFLSVSRTYGLSFKELLIIDSTTIGLFSDILKGVGRNPKNDGKKKGGLKVHMLIDAASSISRFVKISEARSHDRLFLSQLQLSAHSLLVFDKAYNDYCQFAKWTEQTIFFVTRQKENAVYTVIEKVFSQGRVKGVPAVIKEELISVLYNDKLEKETLPLILRRIEYQDNHNRFYVFLTNNMDISAEEVALIYKKRWGIEILFKKMKQNFQLTYFYGENENSIRTQVWCTLIAQLLLTVLQKQAATKKAFSTIATMVRIHLISLLNVIELIRNHSRTYRTTEKPWQSSLFVT